MMYLDSTFSSESESPDETEEIPSSILFFKKAPIDESRLARNSIIYKKNNLEKGLTKDKRVTVQQVLDKRTYIRLKRLHGRGIFDFIYGVISTGKEANVYEAEGTLLSQKHRIAIKVYKTSILIFKDRTRYIEGEFRFRRSYLGTKNPRKMVSQWAEKEFRNLRRISLSGVYCPAPIALKDHILVMELIQDSSGLVASKLKDLGSLPLKEWISIYSQVISIMRILYQESKLIHADFSSYNLLYTDSKVIVIDVSQAVENDHPNAMYFLRRDCENITTFFTTIEYHTSDDVDNQQENKNDDFDSEKYRNNELQDENVKFNMLSSYQLFNFITMDMDTHTSVNINTEEEIEQFNREKMNEQDVDMYINKMIYTSKNAKATHLKETIIRKRIYYNAFCVYVQKLLSEKQPLIFVDEKYESKNYISHEASWNSIKLINISGLTVDTLDRLERENNLPEIKLNTDRIVDLKGDKLDGDMSVMETCSEADTEYSKEDVSESDDNNVDEQEEFNENSPDCESNDDNTKDSVKFSGKIPDGIPAKDWKKMVKQMNRERRKHKIPKHIKKSFKHKHA